MNMSAGIICRQELMCKGLTHTHTQQSRTHMCAMHNNISVCMHTFAYICLHFIVMNLCNNNATATEGVRGQPKRKQIDFMRILRCILFIHAIYLFIYSLLLWQANGGGDGGVKSIVNKQYNSPVGIYSEESIAETLSAQAEVLAGGVLG